VTVAPRAAVITGAGIVSSAGDGVEAFRSAIDEGRSGARAAPHLDAPEAHPRMAAVVEDGPVGRRRPRDRAFAMARKAVGEALRAAGIDRHADEPLTGLALGTTLGGADAAQSVHAALLAGRRPRRADLLQAPLHALADHLVRRFGLEGPCVVVSNACVSATAAIGMALDLVRSGETDAVVAGGVDTLHGFNFTGFAALGLLTADRCLPFHPVGSRMLLGEAAAFLVVENEASARRRGARVLAALAGYGSSCDAWHVITPAPDGNGVCRAVRAALADAGMAPDDVDFVSLHGVGTGAMDRMEARAMTALFGDRPRGLPAASLRPVTGHSLGSAGAVDAIACVLALSGGRVFPTPAGDPASILPPSVRLERNARDAPLRVAVNTSSGFGGVNAAIVLRRWEGAS
jgi:3-oxoacyl-[acyl-carrier-protein] synthase II